jgi:aminoglycoside phosphotransferase (APT) family kinase protein
MFASARWIGCFHQELDRRVQSQQVQFLQQYDADYYLSWLERTVRFSGERFPWLMTLQSRFAEILEPLLAAPPTVIHGEYYPKNILILRGTAYPIEWESAALGAGEIDLAGLTEGWQPAIAQECRHVYCRARWPSGASPHFERTLQASAIYLLLRWTGERPEWTAGEGAEWAFRQMHSLSQRLGVLR